MDTIVSAVGTAVGQFGHQTAWTRKIEAAMVDAVKEAQAEGITDPVVIRARILDARTRLLARGV